MGNVISAIKNTVSITMFNKGMAGKIFNEVKKNGAKVVMKNNAAECVLISPEEYVKLIDEINDARLLTIASTRMQNFDENKLITQDEIDKEFDFDNESLKDIEVEFE